MKICLTTDIKLNQFGIYFQEVKRKPSYLLLERGEISKNKFINNLNLWKCSPWFKVGYFSKLTHNVKVNAELFQIKRFLKYLEKFC